MSGLVMCIISPLSDGGILSSSAIEDIKRSIADGGANVALDYCEEYSYYMFLDQPDNVDERLKDVLAELDVPEMYFIVITNDGNNFLIDIHHLKEVMDYEHRVDSVIV